MENEGDASNAPEENATPQTTSEEPVQAEPVNTDGGPDDPNKQGTGKLVAFGFLLLLFLVGGIFGVIQLFNKDGGGGESPVPEKPEPVNVVGEFPMKFLKLENNEANMIYSPLSIKYGLNLLSAGADGDTKKEIEEVLNGASITKYKDVEDKLSLANAVFIRNSFDDYVDSSYKDNVVKQYDAEILFDDFTTTSALDKWVDNKTFGLIKEMGLNVSDRTQMVLSNALAIRMDWARIFNGTSFGKNFYLADGSTMRATTMTYDEIKTESVGYYVDDDVKMATIDLESLDDGTQLEFVAVMPTKTDLKTYVKTADANDIIGKEKKKTLSSDTDAGVDLYIPKFGFEYQLDFIKDLNELGIEKAFSLEEANFSKMADLDKVRKDLGEDMNMYVSDAIHKANIDFSEKGVKAAAVTSFAMEVAATAIEPEKEPVKIEIDHPFLFMIMDKKTYEIWFVGTMYEPEKWEERQYDF